MKEYKNAMYEYRNRIADGRFRIILRESSCDHHRDKDHDSTGIQENRNVFLKLLTFTRIVVTFEPLDGFLCSTPEMKARDPYVPFLMSK